MKSRIISLGLVVSLVCLLPQMAEAQIAASNPLEWTALAEGNELINEQIEKQIKGQTQTALLQNSIATEFNQIHKWEKQYNSYSNSWICTSALTTNTEYTLYCDGSSLTNWTQSAVG